MARRSAQHTPARVTSAPAPPAGHDFYGPAVVGALTIGERALDADLLDDVLAELDELEPDAYLAYVRAFVTAGRERAGTGWRYADLTTVVAAAAELLRPAVYLEIGVRRGRSMTCVARRAPACELVGVDLWEPGYAGIDNPGAEHVRAELARVGHRGRLRLLTGSSHDVLPALFRAEPELTFDLVTVDGDHTTAGARLDLERVLPRLRVGGCVAFDDVSHPAHPDLRTIWEAATRDRRYATWAFDDVGYGVALAVRRW